MTANADNSISSDQAVNHIREYWSAVPQFAVILGTGLGAFAEAISVEAVCPYQEIPGFCDSTAMGHAGELVCGRVDSIPVIVLRGRTHCYEDATINQITFPIQVLHELGVKTLIVSCAAGGLSPAFLPGEIMLIEDHVDFLQREIQPCDLFRNRLSTATYDENLCQRLRQIALDFQEPLRMGTYVSVSGPNYETRAEMRFYRTFADAIGMSTVPEVNLAHQLGMKVCGLATITNLCNPDALTVADGENVVHVAAESEPVFRKLVLELIRRTSKKSSTPDE